METRTLVQSAANVVQVTSLAKGDVYKRLETSTYSAAKLMFGTVTDVLNNGDDATIVALEYDSTYSSVDVNTKVFATDADLKLFPADPREYEDHLEKLLQSARKASESAYAAYVKAEDIVGRVEALRGLELTTPATLTIEAL